MMGTEYSDSLRRAGRIRSLLACTLLLIAGGPLGAVAVPPCITALTTDRLAGPMGLDDPRPVFAWKIVDPMQGARQSAYRIVVATDAQYSSLVWDSGKVQSDQSLGVRYAGKPLEPARRYFWRVQVWNKSGAQYPTSPTAGWETGLMTQDWKSEWIGYEQPEDKLIRTSNAQWITNAPVASPKVANAQPSTARQDSRSDFRFALNLDASVSKAELLATGQDTAGAWVNGEVALRENPLPDWHHSPWKTYVRHDITALVRPGPNTVAIEVKQYGAPGPVPSPMSACIYVQFRDGTTRIFTSDTEHWKAMQDAPAGWEQRDFADSEWKNAVAVAASNQPGHPWPTGPVVLLRKTFRVPTHLVSARLYVTALGSYVMRLNGARIGNQILSPGWTDYRERVTYQTFDVTSMVRAGKNALGAYLAPAWYCGPLMWLQQGYNYGNTPPALRAQLRLEFADGHVETVRTDGTWKAHVSEIEQAEIYNGQREDKRNASPGWDRSSFEDSAWAAPEIVEPTPLEVVAQDFEPIRIERVLTAKSITSPQPGLYVYDFGQNLAGVERLRISGRAGETVKLRFAEVLNPDGTLYVANLRSAKATDYYTLSGRGQETFQPEFTFHGFRYAEISNIDAKPSIDALQAVVFHSDAKFTSKLSTGSNMINQLWANILWGQRSNFIGVPTDCPQRDERLGWSADAQVFWRTASYNMALSPFSRKFSRDLRGTQAGTAMYGIFAPGVSTSNPGFGMGWSDAGVIIPWTDWLQQRDEQAVDENWDAMDRYLNQILKANPDHLWKNEIGIPFGDWLAPGGRAAVDLIATAYWAYDTKLMQDMAHATGRTADEKRYAELHESIKQAFVATYTRTDGYVGGGNLAPSPFASGVDQESNRTLPETQTGYVLALYMDLLPSSARHAAADKLAVLVESNQSRLATGFLGTPYLLAALTENGHEKLAYDLLLSTKYPSWGYLVEHGATTMWERWNGDQMRSDPSMNSYNHYAYGAVGEWIYRYAAGIDAIPSDPGFHTIRLQPHFDPRMKNMNFEYETPYGTAKSSWQVIDKAITWQVTVPANAQAEVRLSPSVASTMMLDGVSLSSSPKVEREQSGPDSFGILAAGTYTFQGQLP